jgi:starch-binding outer membrane protein, SusD/RagB family
MFKNIIAYKKTHTVFLFNSFVLLMFVSTACKKFVEPNAPVTGVTSENVYSNDATATAVLTGIYGRMSQELSCTGRNFSISWFVCR